MTTISEPIYVIRQVRLLSVVALLFWLFVSIRIAEAKTGFLVVAPDRGALGNQDIRAVFAEFSASYAPASLAFVGRDYRGVGTEYSQYVSRALIDLRQAGATNVVAIPLFVSSADPIIQRVKASLPAYEYVDRIDWAQSMSDSHLIGQVVLDRAADLSRDPDHERVIIVGFGATDESNEQALQADLAKLSEYLARYRRFRESRTLVYYDQVSPMADGKNASADAVMTQMAAKKGHALVIFATLGPKYDHTMALTSSFRNRFQEMDVSFSAEELVPHPNVLRWMKKMANAHLPASSEEIGVVIMPHGANQIWNDAVERIVSPLASTHRVEMAFGMGDSLVIQAAVDRLEARNVRRIVFVRLYALGRHLKDRTDYVLGLSNTPPSGGHGGHDGGRTPPPQIRSAALFASFGGYEESPEVARILHERIVQLSREPEQETVLLIAHGDRTDEGNALWLSVMHAHIERLRQDPHCAQLKAIRAATVREDWPEQRDKAVMEIRTIIDEASKNGRTLLVADRLYGAGPYRQLFEGLDYDLNDQGLAHPALTDWLRAGIDQAVATMAQPMPEGKSTTAQ